MGRRLLDLSLFELALARMLVLYFEVGAIVLLLTWVLVGPLRVF